MPDSSPYLSIIVAARNDDHGGNLLGRMQIFLDGWIAQARRYSLSSELIIVEWNPQPDRPRLRDVLRWPAVLDSCEVRFIEVPPELHQRYKHAEALPLYQMIAKNVGIRRARGRFILATNIDILFSDELVAFLAQRRLDASRMYRIDRHDAMSDVPEKGTLDEQLEYCRTHLLRINAREGTFPLTPDGLRALAKEDIAAPDSGVSLGRGWYAPERYPRGAIFRWIEDDADLHLTLPPTPSVTLRIELEPGPSMGHRPMVLEVLDGPQSILDVRIDCRTAVRVNLLRLGAPERTIRLRVKGGGDPIPHDSRILNCRVFSCRFEDTGGAPDNSKSTTTTAVATAAPVDVRNRIAVLWQQIQLLIRRMAESGPLMTITVPVSPTARRMSAFYVGCGGFTGIVRICFARLLRSASTAKPTTRGNLEPLTAYVPPLLAVTNLHTNACGDFTLAAREHWLDIRGYPEFDMYSMNIDSVGCYALHHAGAHEEMLAEPMRIYHIEHGTGSGWTPEGQAALFERLAAKGIPWLPWADVVGWVTHMRRLNCPMIFNHENWGLADFDLKESRPQPVPQVPSAQPRVRGAGDSV